MAHSSRRPRRRLSACIHAAATPIVAVRAAAAALLHRAPGRRLLTDGRRRERDVAERERSLALQRAALVQVVSHEFRTPLTVIRGGLETLRRPEVAIDDRFVELLDATMRAVYRLEDMAEVILAASDELDLVDTVESLVELADLVRNAARSIGPEADRRLEMKLDGDVRLTTVEPYLWLTIRCLLDNAVKFSPSDEPIEVTFAARGDRSVITLRDHGPGLPEDFEGSAFEPFTQADTSLRRTHRGLGMGLYTARRLARRMGGDVEVHSLGHAGTAADVILPRSGKDLVAAHGGALR